jgi:DNA-binding MarR family transcriptional regulator
MNTLEKALDTLAFLPSGNAKDATLAQVAAKEALAVFLSATAAGSVQELQTLAKTVFRSLPPTRPMPTADSWVVVLETVGQLAQRLYELTAPRDEALKLLARPRVAAALQAIRHKDQIQARELRSTLGIAAQPNLARIAKKLVAAGLVAVDRDRDNAAWYRLTLVGRRLAEARFGESARTPRLEPLPGLGTSASDSQPSRADFQDCGVLVSIMDEAVRGVAVKALEGLNCENIVSAMDPLRAVRSLGTSTFSFFVTDVRTSGTFMAVLSKMDPRLARCTVVIVDSDDDPAAVPKASRWVAGNKLSPNKLRECLQELRWETR